MKTILIFIGILAFMEGCHSSFNQVPPDPNATATTVPHNIIGGGCDGCELMFEGMPDKMDWIDTLADKQEAGTRIEVSGTVYHSDGTTPAEGVIVYFYNTDAKGYYSPGKDQKTGLRNGHLRGWIRTNALGQYKICTIQPAPYPGASIPAHIHCTIKEPHLNEYYVDEIEFEDDHFLTDELKQQRKKRGGSGIVTLSKNQNGVLLYKRDIILGLNIPGY
ncbi:MAG: hypothetical protein ABIO46_04065 [Chitinophagales bacterium]